ncbi:MAG: MarR family transcriptional regulator [Acidimicrobiaceae bacterium]|nr:MarR family transcriptional regulator [Acidimicrobiaceae bacterium]
MQLATLGLTPPQAGTLRAIAQAPGGSVRSIARLLGSDPTNTKRCVDELEGIGLVVGTGKGGGRSRSLWPSQSGELVIKRITELAFEQQARLVGTLSNAELLAFMESIAKLERLVGVEVWPGYGESGIRSISDQIGFISSETDWT